MCLLLALCFKDIIALTQGSMADLKNFNMRANYDSIYRVIRVYDNLCIFQTYVFSLMVMSFSPEGE